MESGKVKVEKGMLFTIYNSLRGKVYSDIQHQIRREFGVSRYEAIKRSQLEMAKEIISNYKVPLVLENEIKLLNEEE